MRYMLMLFNEESADHTEDMSPWNAFGEEAGRRCKSVEGAALQPSTTATVVSIRDGKRIMTDGPFVETKEQIGGYYVLDCDNLDVALDLAAKIPWALTGHVEVRPVLELH